MPAICCPAATTIGSDPAPALSTGGSRRAGELSDLARESARLFTEGIRFAHRLLELDPAEERTYQRLMRLHALNGDRTRALQTYHECVARLQHELGVEPSPETLRLYEEVLNREVSAPIGDAPGRVDVLRLIDRQSEWEMLRVAWQQTVRNHVATRRDHWRCGRRQDAAGRRDADLGQSPGSHHRAHPCLRGPQQTGVRARSRAAAHSDTQCSSDQSSPITG